MIDTDNPSTRLHSIFLTGQRQKLKFLPPQILDNISRLQNTYKNWTHTLYHDDEAFAFLQENFDTETVQSFKTLVPLAYKADLLRYCLLYQYGGLYSDLSILHLAPLISSTDRCELKIFRDHLNGPSIVSNSLIYSKQGSLILSRAISQINENVKKKAYGTNALHPTGPIMLGKIAAIHFKPNIMKCGDVQRVKNAGATTDLYYDDFGNMVAIKHKVGKGISMLGGVHDSYQDHYKSRQIYGETKLVLEATAQTDFEPMKFTQCIIEDGLLKFNGSSSIPVYGPYINIEQGRYKISGELIDRDKMGELFLNLSADSGIRQIAHTRIESDSFCYFIDIPWKLADFEIRLITKDCEYFCLKKIGIEKM